MIGFVDQLLNTLAGRIGRAPIQKRAHHGEGHGCANTGYSHPDQGAGEVVCIAAVFMIHVERIIMRSFFVLLTASMLFAVSPAPNDVVVDYAGSLVTPMEGPIAADLPNLGLHFVGEGRGSKALEHLIASGLRKPDIFISADASLVDDLDKLGLVESKRTFGGASMVLGYSASSPHRTLFELVAAGKMSLASALRTPGLRIGRTDPAVDPKGVRTIKSLRLMGLPSDLGAVYPEEDLLARIEIGTIDAGFLYSTESIARKLQSIPLPPGASLSKEITFTIAVMKGAPHPAAAQQFATYLESGNGRKILQAAGVAYFDHP